MRTRLCLIALFCAASAFAQGVSSPFPNYGDGGLVMSATPGTQGGAVGAFWNPAGWAAMRGYEIGFTWNDRDVTPKRMDNWGLFVGGHGLGFAMRRSDAISASGRQLGVNDYQIALGGGTRGDYWGLSYNWSKGDIDTLAREHSLALGNMARPSRFFSIGNAFSLGLRDGDFRGISDLGIRPLGSHRATLFGDAAYGRLDNASTMQWGVGAEIMPLDGIRVAGKISKLYADTQDKVFTLSVGLSMDGSGISFAPHYDKDSERLSTSYMIRAGDLEPSFSTVKLINPEDRIVAINMKGNLTYRKSLWWDTNKNTLVEIINLLDDAKKDPAVDGVILNLSGLSATREMLWEVREKLIDVKSSGKKVYVYFDRAGMSLYNLASVADYLWMDLQGSIVLPGYISGSTYYKGFLEKIGIGVEEWRYFKYKSAMELLARRGMSDAEREQRLDMITDFYIEWSRDVIGSRGIAADTLRLIVDSLGVLTAEEALAFGLIDTVGRWDDSAELIEGLAGSEPSFIERDDVRVKVFSDPSWGDYPKVALVYAIGECDMDTGIRGRYTSRLLRDLADDDDIKAVVLRVDSPGGDALPSDLVAAQMTNVSNQKPMIVSQGGVAASGGYWLSMNGDKIYTSPYTITGSIGVIGGWVWNQGLSDKTGFTSDFVKIGEHADMGFGVTLPLIGATIPDRNIDEHERSRVEFHIRDSYSKFINKVADGRGLDTIHVDSVGQGRIWSGRRAIDKQLTDEIGGLETAIDYAKQQAGISASREIDLIEYPKRSWLNLDELFQPASPIGVMARLFGWRSTKVAGSDENYEVAYLKRIAQSPGVPLMLTPPEDIPQEDSVSKPCQP